MHSGMVVKSANKTRQIFRKFDRKKSLFLIFTRYLEKLLFIVSIVVCLSYAYGLSSIVSY
jgi:hypothetical protein